MTAKLSRDEILRGILQTLVDGWGYGVVLATIESLSVPQGERIKPRKREVVAKKAMTASEVVAEMPLPNDTKSLMLRLAERFDEGSAFPKITDIRSFLVAHHHDAKNLKGRPQAFKRMLPVLSGMSEKGLEKVISRSHHSGPAELDAISNAIRGAGEDLRGAGHSYKPSPLEEPIKTDTIS